MIEGIYVVNTVKKLEKNRSEKLELLINAIRVDLHGRIIADDVDGRNWFDLRDELIRERSL